MADSLSSYQVSVRIAPEWPKGVPPIGDVLDGKCRIDGLVGVGGMGVVLEATHLHLEKRVAIKMLLPELADHAEIGARFLREGRAAAKIQSEHVTRVLDVATLPSGQPYMVMELLEGQDLGAVLDERRRLPVEEAVGYILEACDALLEAHAKGIVHRDLKPSNLFLARRDDGTRLVKVLDFGISKVLGTGDEHLSITKSRAILGSPLYMSPEQLTASRDVDGRADVWALGVILFELIAGRPPFEANTVAELGARVLAGAAPSLRSLAPEVDATLDGIVTKCLSRDRADRFGSIAELVVALAPFVPSERREASLRSARRAFGSDPNLKAAATVATSAPRAIGDQTTQAATAGSWSTLASAKPRSYWGALLAGLVVAALGAGSLFWSLKPTAMTPAAAGPTAAPEPTSQATPPTPPVSTTGASTTSVAPPAPVAAATPTETAAESQAAATTTTTTPPAQDRPKRRRPTAPRASSSVPAPPTPPPSDRFN